jgi:hypothetical protein
MLALLVAGAGVHLRRWVAGDEKCVGARRIGRFASMAISGVVIKLNSAATMTKMRRIR